MTVSRQSLSYPWMFAVRSSGPARSITPRTGRGSATYSGLVAGRRARPAAHIAR